MWPENDIINIQWPVAERGSPPLLELLRCAPGPTSKHQSHSAGAGRGLRLCTANRLPGKDAAEGLEPHLSSKGSEGLVTLSRHQTTLRWCCFSVSAAFWSLNPDTLSVCSGQFHYLPGAHHERGLLQVNGTVSLASCKREEEGRNKP